MHVLCEIIKENDLIYHNLRNRCVHVDDKCINFFSFQHKNCQQISHSIYSREGPRTASAPGTVAPRFPDSLGVISTVRKGFNGLFKYYHNFGNN